MRDWTSYSLLLKPEPVFAARGKTRLSQSVNEVFFRDIIPQAYSVEDIVHSPFG